MRTIEGFSSATYSLSASKLSRRPHIEEAGDQTVGLSVPAAMSSCASPELTDLPRTTTRLPSIVGSVAL